MHKFLRAIGFSKIKREDIKDLVLQSVKKNDSRGYTMSLDDVMQGHFQCVAGLIVGLVVVSVGNLGNANEADQ